MQFEITEAFPLNTEPRSGSDRVVDMPFKSEENQILSLVDIAQRNPVATAPRSLIDWYSPTAQTAHYQLTRYITLEHRLELSLKLHVFDVNKLKLEL
jgi:hypothetical protein